MADMVCSKCNVGWEILEHNRYCGYCGCEAFGFSVKWKDDPLYYKGDRTDIHELTIIVENAGATQITFQPIKIESGNALKLTEEDKTFTVKPGKPYTTEVQVDPDKLKTEYPEKIVVCAKNVSPDGIKSLELRTLPIPEFTLKPNSIPLEYPKSKETVPVEFKIEYQQNTFHIENIESSQGLINSVDLSKAPDTFHLEINCSQLEEGFNSDTLKFKLRGPSKPIEKQIQIQAKRLPEPAKLFVPETHLEIIQDREQTHTLRLENRGEDTLEINKIILADTSGSVQLPHLEFPIPIEGGKEQEVEISVSSVGAEPVKYPNKLTILSNCATAPKYQHTLNIKVKEREPYLHYLAIDFGTTNSCCAYIDENDFNKLKPIPLEDRTTDDSGNPTIPDPTIMPSSIIYRVEPENGRDYDVGSKADTARMDSRDGPYYISSVKRWLGYGWHRQFPNNKDFQPVDVVSHILKHIINKAENYLEQHNLPSKITRCVVTHPTKFNQQQQDALRQAFGNIGITDLILIDEASAASIGIIIKYENLPEDYRLLVYDFGGGTIDIVLSQVTKKGDDITIEPIARDGDPKYGGDDVTQAIVDYIISEYRRRIEEISPGHKFDIPYCGPGQILQPTGNTDVDNAVRNNSTNLYRRAEEMKRDLGTQSETEFTIDINVVEHDVTTTLTTFIEKIIRNDIQDESDLQKRPQDIVRVKLTEAQFELYIQRALYNTFAKIDTMIADTGECLPDLVVLAGQSSKMRFVKQMMADHFKNKYQKDIEIHLDDNPKTCVVMGAAEYSMPYTVPIIGGDVNIINLSNKTHTRFGITRYKLGIGNVFGEIIPKGKLIPVESYGTTELPLKTMLIPIKVLEHFGSDDNLDKDKVSPINTFNLKLPENVAIEELRSTKLKMAVKLNGEIELTAIVGDHKYPFIVQREIPPFVKEIHSTTPVIKIDRPQTTPVIKPDKPQTISPYQREAEKAIQDARKQVADLARRYQEGEPVDFENTFPAESSQKVILLLNMITLDLCKWISELKQSGQTDILQTVTYAEMAIKDKLKTIRVEDIPTPVPLNPPTDVTTETELNRIQKKCADYINKFQATLRRHELNREIDATKYKQFILQFIKNDLFNNVTRNMPFDALPEKLKDFLQLVGFEIVPIKIGETQADSRVHDIQGSKQTSVRRGTIAEVIQPGLMNKIDGKIVQKPVVIRGE